MLLSAEILGSRDDFSQTPTLLCSVSSGFLPYVLGLRLLILILFSFVSSFFFRVLCGWGLLFPSKGFLRVAAASPYLRGEVLVFGCVSAARYGFGPIVGSTLSFFLLPHEHPPYEGMIWAADFVLIG